MGDIARQYREKKRSEIKMTARDTRDLFQSIDKILQFASDDSGLATRATVGRQMLGQEDVEKQVRANLDDDKSVRRMENAQLTLKKFGLLPRDFEIRKLAASVAGENIAAFYDPKKKTINMMNWIPVAQQRPVLAHELTHALQDQNYNLDRWMGGTKKTTAKRRLTMRPMQTWIMANRRPLVRQLSKARQCWSTPITCSPTTEPAWRNLRRWWIIFKTA